MKRRLHSEITEWWSWASLMEIWRSWSRRLSRAWGGSCSPNSKQTSCGMPGVGWISPPAPDRRAAEVLKAAWIGANELNLFFNRWDTAAPAKDTLQPQQASRIITHCTPGTSPSSFFAIPVATYLHLTPSPIRPHPMLPIYPLPTEPCPLAHFPLSSQQNPHPSHPHQDCLCPSLDQVRISWEPTTKARLWVWMVSGLQCSKTVHRVSDDASETVIRSGKHHPKPPSASGLTQKHTDQETETSHLKDRAPQKVFPSCGNSTAQFLPVKKHCLPHTFTFFHSVLHSRLIVLFFANC